MFNQTITLYNAVHSGYGTTYHAKVLENVELQITTGASSDKTGLKSADKADLFIKLRSDYLPPKKWLESDSKDNFFTLKNGDFFIKGENIIENADYQQIKNSYDDVFKINSVDTVISDTLSHWEVHGA